ncbi:MBL fold metallo-hydrolase [Ureibacillus sp. FSL K6-8385]|uniref:MBL fold metallo-hydrolase n=1 Tax=Ureibacillus terrenus TaxID=118246 RepID=A0A540V1P1_9BACL|nr:MBL fold metallo-hydrolase [Ureibacillus terrenus]MED3662040.1 MBL fold metallo-hydrolase [Ureibacillus terrenus]MED3764681.1 MBL fold metallo-hydrolase [Ureibacillus terrenus]TQE90665.1 MBL fold metallo-hydrolase [Ureibacillus terrenus]
MFLQQSFFESEHGDVKLFEGKNVFSQVKLNVYSFYQDGILIDCGAHSMKKAFINFFDRLSIDRVVITHAHEDHDGCAKYLSERGIPVYLHPMSIEKSRKRADYLLYRKFFWGIRPPYHAIPHEETFQSRKYRWRIIETPGHAVDHVAFLNESTGQLFSGDLFVTPRTKLIMRTENIPQIIQSIEKLLRLDFGEMFCSHAGYIKDGKQALRNKLDYLYELTDKVRSLAREGCSIEEIQRQLFPRKYQISVVSRGEWDSKHIITSILSGSHLVNSSAKQ